MPAYVRAVISGTIRSAQSWSVGCSFIVIGSGAPSQNDLDTWVNAYASGVTTWWGAAGGAGHINGPDVNVTKISGYFYEGRGTTAGLVSQKSVLLTGSAATQFLPPQVSVVQSLRTGTPGRMNMGRMYVPATAAAIGSSTMQLSQTQCDQLATATAALINHGNEAALGSTAVGAGPLVGGVGNYYDQVIVDSRLDTQRRRQDKLSAMLRGSATI